MEPVQVAFAVIAVCAAAYFVSRVVRFKSFVGAVFGARVHKVGEVYLQSSEALMKHVIRVHHLSGGKPGRDVGVELTSKSLASYSMRPVTLSTCEAIELVALLQQAIAKSQASETTS